MEILCRASSGALGDAGLDGLGIDLAPQAQAITPASQKVRRRPAHDPERRAHHARVARQRGQRRLSFRLGRRLGIVEQLVGQHKRIVEVPDAGGGVEVVVHGFNETRGQLRRRRRGQVGQASRESIQPFQGTIEIVQARFGLV